MCKLFYLLLDLASSKPIPAQTIPQQQQVETNIKKAPTIAEITSRVGVDTTDKAAPIKSSSQQVGHQKQPNVEQKPLPNIVPPTQTAASATPSTQTQSAPLTIPPVVQTPTETKLVKTNESDASSSIKTKISQPEISVAQTTDNLNKLDINDKNNNLNKPPSESTQPISSVLVANSNTTTAPIVDAKISVKLNDLNCWTPENKEGKKRYDRDFLISFKDKKLSRTFPEVLKAYTDILFSSENTNMMMMMNSNSMGMSNKGSMQGNYDNYNKNKFGSMGGDGGGGYGKGSMNKNKQKGSMNMNKMNKGSEGDRHQPPAVIHLPEKIVLNTVENPYQIKRKTQVELNEHDELLREVRNILNKLTPQNLQKLTGDLINLSINNEDRLKGSIDIIFEKSIDEQVFSQTYANLCKVRYCYVFVHKISNLKYSGGTQ